MVAFIDHRFDCCDLARCGVIHYGTDKATGVMWAEWNWAHISILKAAGSVKSNIELLYSTSDFRVVVQNHIQQGTVDFNLRAVVIDKA